MIRSPGFFLGAYATAPSINGWDEAAETHYFDALKTFENLRGIEHPISDKLHPHDERWFLKTLDPRWDVVLTLLPGTMARMTANPHHGLASDDAAGRAEAIAFLGTANAAVHRLNQQVNRKRVTAVEVHSAPRRGAKASSSASSFARSLEDISSWDWGGARICIEHCDAWQPDIPPIKGFLTLEEEILAIQRDNDSTGADFGLIINWGRSVLEARHVDQALKHIKMARTAGVLSGVIFSGCSGAQTPWNSWDDTHMPHAPATGLTYAADHSLMTEDAIEAAVRAAGDDASIMGSKITAFPSDAGLDTRVGLNRDALTLLDRVVSRLRGSTMRSEVRDSPAG